MIRWLFFCVFFSILDHDALFVIISCSLFLLQPKTCSECTDAVADVECTDADAEDKCFKNHAKGKRGTLDTGHGSDTGYWRLAMEISNGKYDGTF